MIGVVAKVGKPHFSFCHHTETGRYTRSCAFLYHPFVYLYGEYEV